MKWQFNTVLNTLFKATVYKMRDRLIPLEQACKETPYDANYLGLLVRKNLLPAKKLKGRWMTTSNDVEAYLRTHARVTYEGSDFRKKAVVLGASLVLLIGLGAFVSSTMLFWNSEDALRGVASVGTAAVVQAFETAPAEVTVVSTDGSSSLSSRMTQEADAKDGDTEQDGSELTGAKAL